MTKRKSSITLRGDAARMFGRSLMEARKLPSAVHRVPTGPAKVTILDEAADPLLPPGTERYFEYHCWEDPRSGDADLWYRSHQKVTVLGIDPEGEPAALTMTREERLKEGIHRVYKIRFADGFEKAAFEDELLSSPAEYQRPDPPKETK